LSTKFCVFLKCSARRKNLQFIADGGSTLITTS